MQCNWDVTVAHTTAPPALLLQLLWVSSAVSIREPMICPGRLGKYFQVTLVLKISPDNAVFQAVVILFTCFCIPRPVHCE